MTYPDGAPSPLAAALDSISATASLDEQKKAFGKQLSQVRDRAGKPAFDVIARHAHPDDPGAEKKAPKVSNWFKGTSAADDWEPLRLALEFLGATTEESAAFRRAYTRLSERRSTEAKARGLNLNRAKSGAAATAAPSAQPNTSPQTPPADNGHPAVSRSPTAPGLVAHMRKPTWWRHRLRRWWIPAAAAAAFVIVLSVALHNDGAQPAARPQAAEPSSNREPQRTPVGAPATQPTSPVSSAASAVRTQWSYPDGSHLAVVDNASGPGGWVWIDDRQADRHWAAVVFLLRGEPWSFTRDPARWHTYIDDNGANNGDRLKKPGASPTIDISAAAICEGVGSDLDPDSCSEWRRIEAD